MNKKKLKLNATTLIFLSSVLAGGTAVAQTAKKAPHKPGINLDLMDKSVKPGDDFFRFVNGKWFDKTEIPADKSRWGSFDELRQNTDKDALAILKEAIADKKLDPKSDQAKAVNLYATYMDTIARNKAGITPLKPYLDKIDAVKNIADLNALMTELQPFGGIGFYGIGVGADAKDSNKNVVYLGVSGLGLPDREYYISEDKDSKEKREKYVLHITKMLQYLGETPEQAKSNADKILALEIALAKPRFDRVQLRDDRNTYNPMSIAELQKIAPFITWENYLTGVGIKGLQSIVIEQPKYMTALDEIFKNTPIDAIKADLRWNLLRGNSGLLSTSLEKANWEFYGKTLGGAKKQRPIEERALQVVNGTIGEALGKLYVAKKFPAEAKVKAEKMIKNVILAYQDRITNLTWMSPETKVSAINKLNKIAIKIGYPDKWRDYSKLQISSITDGGSYFENAKKISKWRFEDNLAELQKPVDKTRWGMSPQTVNAYYNPSYNEIVFPAAILQPPFYDYRADEAVNYGGIGAVIGHEISHGFDDSGARYNAEGNLVDWWTETDLKQFTDLGGALADQYSALEPLPGTHVDGKFTLGENIGDLGGVNVAYDGLQLFLKQNKKQPLIDGYTPEQRFFISWGTIWRSKMRDEAIKSQVKTDPHSPGMYRAYVPLTNVDAFYKAFNIKEGDKLYVKPEKRVKIW